MSRMPYRLATNSFGTLGYFRDRPKVRVTLQWDMTASPVPCRPRGANARVLARFLGSALRAEPEPEEPRVR